MSATNYYVKNGGSDSSSGLDDANAWAHHPWMSTWTGNVSSCAGDIVYMKRGDTWSISNPVAPFVTARQSGTPGNPIKTTAYGPAINPVIQDRTFNESVSNICFGKSYFVFDNLHIQHYSRTYMK